MTVQHPEVEERRRLIQHLGEVLTLRFGRGKSVGGSWAWWRYAPVTTEAGNILPLKKDWSSNETPWLQIENGDLDEMIIAATVKINVTLHSEAPE